MKIFDKVKEDKEHAAIVLAKAEEDRKSQYSLPFLCFKIVLYVRYLEIFS